MKSISASKICKEKGLAGISQAFLFALLPTRRLLNVRMEPPAKVPAEAGNPCPAKSPQERAQEPDQALAPPSSRSGSGFRPALPESPRQRSAHFPRAGSP